MTRFWFLILGLGLSFPAWSQTKIDFFVADVPVKEALTQLSKASKIEIAFSPEFFDTARLISVDVQQASFESILKKVLKSCDEALEIDGASIKALFRKATALEKLGDVDAGRKCTKAGLAADAENKEFLALDRRLERAQAIAKQKAQKMYGKMFG